MRMTIQVAPDDCTGCGICVDVCPAHSKEQVKHKAIDMEPKLDHLDERARELRLLPLDPRPRPHARSAPSTVKGSQQLPPLFEFSGACAGCGETPYLKLLTQLVRRPDAGRERHGLLVDLRRQPAHDAVVVERRRPGAGVVELAVRGQRRVRTRHAARRSTRSADLAPSCSRTLEDELGESLRARSRRGRCRVARPSDADRRGSACASTQLRARLSARWTGPAPATSGDRRRAGADERVDRRRRRLGVRHRLRRPRPRARGPQREHPRARHRGLLEHRRPGVEGHAARRRREVRRGRQGAGRRTSA